MIPNQYSYNNSTFYFKRFFLKFSNWSIITMTYDTLNILKETFTTILHIPFIVFIFLIFQVHYFHAILYAKASLIHHESIIFLLLKWLTTIIFVFLCFVVIPHWRLSHKFLLYESFSLIVAFCHHESLLGWFSCIFLLLLLLIIIVKYISNPSSQEFREKLNFDSKIGSKTSLDSNHSYNSDKEDSNLSSLPSLLGMREQVYMSEDEYIRKAQQELFLKTGVRYSKKQLRRRKRREESNIGV